MFGAYNYYKCPKDHYIVSRDKLTICPVRVKGTPCSGVLTRTTAEAIGSVR